MKKFRGLRSSTIILLFTFAIFPLHGTHSQASTVYFVDNQLTANCLNNNYSIATRSCTGTDGNAYIKINDAIRAVPAGGIINVRQGTYQEVYNYLRHYQAEAAFYIDKPLTLKNYNSEEVTLTYIPSHPPKYANGLSYIIYIVSNDVTLDGFTIVGTKTLGDNVDNDNDVNIYIEKYLSNVTIRNNIIKQAGHAGVKYLLPKGLILVEKNQFYDIGFTPRDHGIYGYTENNNTVSKIIRQNIFHNISGYGIHLYSESSNHDVYNNIVYNNTNGGILITGDHQKIYNNVIYGNQGQGGLVLFGGLGYYVHDENIQNNIIWNNVLDVNCGSDTYSNIFEHNIVQTMSGSGCPGTTNLAIDPQFISSPPTSWPDFRLANGSPLVDQGTDLGYPYNLALDPASTAWPPLLGDQNYYGSKWEIGAFVAGSAATPPPDTTPPTVSITSPLNNTSVPKNSTIIISATASDNVGVSKLEFYVNGSLVCTDILPSYTCSWQTPRKANQGIQFTAKAYDAAGNTANSAVVQVTTS